MKNLKYNYPFNLNTCYFGKISGWLFLLFLLPAISMQAQEDTTFSKVLPDITITAKRKPLKESARGAVLDISKIPDAKLLTLADVLTMIPGLTIEGEKIFYMGTEVSVQRNGVNVAGFSKQIGYDLDRLTATNYAKIELNLYDLKTEKPSISFDTRRTPNAYFGSVGLGADINGGITPSASVYLSRGRHIFNVFTSGGLSKSPSMKMNSELLYHNTGILEKMNSDNGAARGYNYNLGISHNFTITKKQILNTSVSIRQNGSSATSYTERYFYTGALLTDSSKISNSITTPFNGNYVIDANLTYTYLPQEKPTGKQRWDFSAEYNNSSSKAQNDYVSEYLVSKNDFSSLTGKQSHSLFLLVAYRFDHKKSGTFESVIKYFNRQENNDYDYTTPNTTGSFNQGNDIRYQYTAWLASWDKSYTSFSVRTVIKTDYNNTDALNTGTGDRFRMDFFSFSPYLSLFRKMKSGTLRLETQYMQLRPGLDKLSSITEIYSQYSTSGVQRRGNPYLKNTKRMNTTAIYNATFGQLGFVASAKYTYEKTPITNYYFSEDTLLVSSYMNIKASHQYGGSTSFNFYAFPRFMVRMSGTMYASNFIVTSDSLKRGYQWNTNIDLSYVLTPELRMSVSTGYGAGKIFQGKYAPRVNTRFSCSYNKNKMSFSLGASQFHRPYIDNITYYNEAGFSGFRKISSRMLMVNLSFGYSFGKSKEIKTGKAILKDDM